MSTIADKRPVPQQRDRMLDVQMLRRGEIHVKNLTIPDALMGLLLFIPVRILAFPGRIPLTGSSGHELLGN